jgi:MmgE/PrpD C-terminal domain
MQKIRVTEDPALTARVGGAVPTRITAIVVDGQRIVREVDHAPGFAERPMSSAEVERKFRGNVGKRWPKERTDGVLHSLCDAAIRDQDQLAVMLGRRLVERRATVVADPGNRGLDTFNALAKLDDGCFGHSNLVSSTTADTTIRSIDGTTKVRAS